MYFLATRKSFCRIIKHNFNNYKSSTNILYPTVREFEAYGRGGLTENTPFRNPGRARDLAADEV